jgi:hypothetical protein
MPDVLVRLPRTATRSKAPSYATLLEKVDPHATSPHDFYGKYMRPGATVEERELWPTENYPAIPVLLEECQIVFTGRGHNRNPMEYLLWIYQVSKSEWRQVAHVSAHHPEEWISSLLPVLLRLVKPAVAPPEPDLHNAACRIAGTVTTELHGLSNNSQRSQLLQLTHSYMCQRHSDFGSSRKLYGKPLESRDDFFDGLLLPAAADELGWSEAERDRATKFFLNHQ